MSLHLFNIWNKWCLRLSNRNLNRKRWLLKTYFGRHMQRLLFSQFPVKYFFRFFSCRLRLHEKTVRGILIVFYVCLGWKNCQRIVFKGLPVILQNVLILSQKKLWNATDWLWLGAKFEFSNICQKISSEIVFPCWYSFG